MESSQGLRGPERLARQCHKIEDDTAAIEPGKRGRSDLGVERLKAQAAKAAFGQLHCATQAFESGAGEKFDGHTPRLASAERSRAQGQFVVVVYDHGERPRVLQGRRAGVGHYERDAIGARRLFAGRTPGEPASRWMDPRVG